MSRILVLLYGLASYLIGVAGLVAIIATLGGFMPWGFMWQTSQTATSPLIWNVGLLALWGIIHTGMARQGFKNVITRVIPNAAERPTYVLIAGLTSVLLVGYWCEVPGQIWLVSNPTAVTFIWVLFWFGWVFLLLSTFAINHFDLFGLRQVYLHYKQMPEAPIAFVKRAMYAYIRHPIQTGVLIGVWATANMTSTHFVMALGFTVYIVIGLWFEERDLIKQHGAEYQKYQHEAGKLFPKMVK